MYLFVHTEKEQDSKKERGNREKTTQNPEWEWEKQYDTNNAAQQEKQSKKVKKNERK